MTTLLPKISVFYLRLTIFLLGFLTFFSQVSSVSAGYYEFDGSAYYLNRTEYNRNKEPLDRNNPPPGRTFASLSEDYDRWAFMTSVQGIANRYKPSLYLIHEPIDSIWKRNFQTQRDVWSWFSNNSATRLGNFDQLADTFKTGYGIQGSVVWDADKPYTFMVAMTVSGADNLVVVRKNSSLYDSLTSKYPVKVDLTTLNSKSEAYNWAVDNYLATGKSNPSFLAYLKDGYPVYLYQRNQMFDPGISTGDFRSWGFLTADYYIGQKAFFFDLPPQTGSNAKDDFGSVGDNYSLLERIFDVVRSKVSSDKLITVGGYPNEKYTTCNGSSDGVICAERPWTRFLSARGAVKRIGEIEMFGTGSPNLSFYQHGTGADFVDQPANPTPRQLLQRDLADGYPLNFSFEKGVENWQLQTTNAVVYTSGGSHGSNFLEVNWLSSGAENRKSVFQDISIPLLRGYRYSFNVKVRVPNGGQARINQVVWNMAGGTTICNNMVTVSGSTWQNISCTFDVHVDGAANPRLELYLETKDINVDFDEAYFDGPNTLHVNPNKKFFLNYLGDYDFANSVYVSSMIPNIGYYRTDRGAGVFEPLLDYLPVWQNRSSDFPAAWGISTSIAREVPPIYAYLAKTKGPADWFVMPDSGAGYVNPGILASSVHGDWVGQTSTLQRQFGYRSGWVTDGGADVNMRNSQAERDMYHKLAPDGILEDIGFDANTPFWDGFFGLVPMENFVFGGHVLGDAHNLWNGKVAPKLSSRQFFPLRDTWHPQKQLQQLFNQKRSENSNIENVDPNTFFNLYRATNGGITQGRATLISANVPTYLVAGQSYNITLTYRNDGWETWIPTTQGNNCGGYSNPSKGCVIFNAGFIPGENIQPDAQITNDVWVQLPHVVEPGQTVNMSFSITAPSTGRYTFKADFAKDQMASFASFGNVPWQKQVETLTRQLDINSDGKVNVSEMDNAVFKYKRASTDADANGDGKVNLIDLQIIKNQSRKNP